MRPKKIPDNFEQYIADLPEIVQKRMTELRSVIKKTAPDATEKISYRMPAFSLKGILVYFAAHENHIGFYPFRSAVKKFSKELKSYYTSEGTIRFLFDKPIPVDLITRIVKFRVKENLEKADHKK